MKCALLTFVLSYSMMAFAAEDPQMTECRAAQKMVSQICKGAISSECKIKDEKQHDEVVKLLKNAPLGGQTLNAASIKELLGKIPTKDSINDLLVKLSGSCEANTYFKLASALGQYHLQVKAPKQIQSTKDTVKEWLEKDMKTDYPTLLSLLVRINIASQYAKSEVFEISQNARKDLEQLEKDLRKDTKKFLTSNDETDPSRKWDPKTWQVKIKEKLIVTKKYADRWLAWLETNWK